MKFSVGPIVASITTILLTAIAIVEMRWSGAQQEVMVMHEAILCDSAVAAKPEANLRSNNRSEALLKGEEEWGDREKSQRRTAGTRRSRPLIAGTATQVCGMDDEALDDVLALKHGSAPWEARYFFEGKWQNIKEVMKVASGMDEGLRPCVVVHVRGQVPCAALEEGCLLQFHIRPNETDLRVLAQILERDEMAGLDPAADFRTILDGGANCGVAAVLLATQYPNARIVSVEPSAGNYKMLLKNTLHFPNVVAFRAGIWRRHSLLVLQGDEAWGLMVTEVGENDETPKGRVVETLTGMSISLLGDLAGVDSFDLLKVDIEGSEKEVFGTSKEDLRFLEKVQVAFIEVHERKRKGANDAVRKAFDEKHFAADKSGEYMIFTRIK